MSEPGITGNGGEYSHLVLVWGDRKLRVDPDGKIEIDGTVTDELLTIGEAFCDWAEHMAAHTPAHPSPLVTSRDPGEPREDG